MTKKLLLMILLFALVCGCTVPPAGDGASAGAAAPEEAPVYRDMDGQAIDPWSEDLSGITLCYTLGWEMDGEGYARLRKDSQWGDATITDAGSTYFIYRPAGYPMETICIASSYAFSCPSAIPGILQVEESGITFFPYQSAGIPMLFLDPRTAGAEEGYAARDRASLRDGTTLEVHPVGIRLLPKDAERTLPLLADGDGALPRWYDAQLRFSSVWVSGFAQAMTEGVIGTRAEGELEWEDPVAVKGELLLTERL